MAKHLVYLLLTIFFAKLACPGQARTITDVLPAAMVSDGVDRHILQPFISLNNLFSANSSCDQTYGFLPCTTTILGNIFLIIVYGYIMFLSAKLLSDGSEILLQILGPGIVGGLFLPVLSAVPDAAIILASGLSGSKETAQSQVSVGMGLMAGSIVLLLTILWGSCIVAGKCDIEGSKAVDLKDTKRFSLTGSGVTTDIWTSYAARIMVISLIPFIIVQLPDVFHTTSFSRIAVLVSFIAAIFLLLCYGLYQVLQPWIQKRRIAYAKHKRVISGILSQLKVHSFGRLFSNNARPNRDTIQKLFQAVDANSDGFLTTAELRALIIGIRFDEMNINIDEAVDQLMKDIDKNEDSLVDVDEFVQAISKWIEESNKKDSSPTISDQLEITEQDQLEDAKETTGNDQEKNQKWNTMKAALMLLLGTIVASVFADPLVDAVDNFSTASTIPSFFVSFVILPFASSSEIVSDLIFASRKKSASASLAYSEIYGSVTMSNVLSLGVFLGLVYFRNLTWDFSAEVLVIVIVCILMGLISSFRTTFPLWLSFVAYALYPLSLLLAYVLDYVFGWS